MPAPLLYGSAMILGIVAPAAETALEMARVNAMDRTAFVATFGGVFENSPWVAAGAFPSAPFASPSALHAAMMGVVRAAPEADRLRLLNAHPELAGKEARAKAMTDHSVAEQGSAGLDRMSEADFARFDRLNAAYREKFGFPFIIAVRGRSRAEIVSEFERRLANPPAVEMEADIEQVGLITRMRLERRLGPFE
ncbi:2-oxo-4-hydroxy-4-carboxy-5-ureidoimidazoline decarboxylase [Methylobacterium trifolii]|uniref:2-oxo-4-hydroxy-4-carboxy-5-ureidoimidazoline decarboxylase n=1 Tax=Methylobacterium trifolii TaxID=1003092 RepID=A0ABQ4U2H7_9HYPH|nr:2-oxo-4-hydroxy-4-carboxy-5-ureidoimidazoline decarboxylase [Methylobacterium trifolii]GJE60951.1 Uric acid degradation bifunctional protein [Methylobacterium trifolii]